MEREGGKIRVREVIRVREKDGTGEGKEGNKVCKVTE